MASTKAGFPLTISKLAENTEVNKDVIRRWRKSRVIPKELRWQENPNTMWRFAEAAEKWVHLAVKIFIWNPPSEDVVAELFEEAAQCYNGNLDEAVKALDAIADDPTVRSFDNFVTKFHQNCPIQDA